MIVTVCQFADDPSQHQHDWDALKAHVQQERSELVLLPEMAFSAWFARQREEQPAEWAAALALHDTWMARLAELAPAIVLGSRPVEDGGGRRLNRAFVAEPGRPLRLAHAKYYLPKEDGFWEACWYGRGDGAFAPTSAGPAKVGFMICSDIWFLERARHYGRQGVHIIANPRGTERATVDKWLVAGRAAAITAGAYCLSSNRVGTQPADAPMGGQGWITGPDGEVLALTSDQAPFASLKIDLAAAEAAKATYPRYMPE